MSESIWNSRITKRYEFYSWAIHSRVVLNPRARQIALDTMISYPIGQSSPLQLSAFERLSGPCHPSSLGWEMCLSRAVVLIVLSLNSHFHWKFQVLQCISSSVSQLLFGSLFWLLGVSFFSHWKVCDLKVLKAILFLKIEHFTYINVPKIYIISHCFWKCLCYIHARKTRKETVQCHISDLCLRIGLT